MALVYTRIDKRIASIYQYSIKNVTTRAKNLIQILYKQIKANNIKAQHTMEAEYAKIFPEAEGIKQSGCYIKNHRDLGIRKVATVPLKHIDYHLDIVNSLLHVTLKQTYENPIDRFLQIDYAFPISPEASIYKFTAEFGNVLIEGIVKEKEEAKKEYKEAKSQGRQVAMGSIDEDSKDIMNLEIGNIPPKTDFVVTVSFLQEMAVSMNTFYKAQIPSTISPRYANKPETMFSWSFKIDLKTTHKTTFFDSPSHKLMMISQNEAGTETTLVLAQAEKPNKDFSFLYTTENFHLPSSVVGHTDTSASVMLSFIPRFCSLDINDAYKAQITNKPFQTDMRTARGDYIFLLDRSESMQGRRMEKAKEALILFLQSLPEKSYYNVVSFGSSSQSLFKKSVCYPHHLKQTVDRISKMKADMVGTKIYEPLQQFLDQKVNQGYPKHVFLLTDGQVQNTEDIVRMIKTYTKCCRVHAIGLGRDASFDLIQRCAQAGKGKYTVISDDENPADKIIELLESVLTAIINKVSLIYDESYVESILPNPKSIPYIFRDQVVNFFITFSKPLTEPTKFAFSYKDSVTKHPYKSEMVVDPETGNQPFVDKMSHLKVLRSLENSAENGITIEDQMLYVKVKDYNKEAIEYSVRHQVLSKFTSFLCIGKELVDGQYQEYQTLGTQKVHEQRMASFLYNLKHFQAKPPTRVQPAAKPPTRVPPPARPPAEQPVRQQWPDVNRHFQPSDRVRRLQGLSHQQRLSMGLTNSQLAMMRRDQMRRYRIPKKEQPKWQEQSEGEQEQCNIATNIKEEGPQQMQRVEESCRRFAPRKSESEERYQRQTVKKGVYKKKGATEQPIKQQIKQKGIHKNEEPNNTISPHAIVEKQHLNGSWPDIAILQLLGVDVQQLKPLIASLNEQIVITQLVVLWMQKYYPEKKYALIIKKAVLWLRTALEKFPDYSSEKLEKDLNDLNCL